jgi:hypothetical protein
MPPAQWAMLALYSSRGTTTAHLRACLPKSRPPSHHADTKRNQQCGNRLKILPLNTPQLATLKIESKYTKATHPGWLFHFQAISDVEESIEFPANQPCG